MKFVSDNGLCNVFPKDNLKCPQLSPQPCQLTRYRAVFLNKFKSCISPFLDPMQFAYQNGRSCEDAILTLLNKMYSHLERARFGNSVRLLFFDFSSAFNTIQPHLLINKMMKMKIPVY